MRKTRVIKNHGLTQSKGCRDQQQKHKLCNVNRMSQLLLREQMTQRQTVNMLLDGEPMYGTSAFLYPLKPHGLVTIFIEHHSAGETCPCNLINHSQHTVISTLTWLFVIRLSLQNCGTETYLRLTATSRNHHHVKALQGCQENLRNKMKPQNHKLTGWHKNQPHKHILLLLQFACQMKSTHLPSVTFKAHWRFLHIHTYTLHTYTCMYIVKSTSLCHWSWLNK